MFYIVISRILQRPASRGARSRACCIFQRAPHYRLNGIRVAKFTFKLVLPIYCRNSSYHGLNSFLKFLYACHCVV